MGRIAVTEAALSGFRFGCCNFQTVAVWAATNVAVALLAGAGTVATMGATLARLEQSREAPSPAESLALLGKLAPFLLILDASLLAFYAVVFATMNRVVLRPEDNRNAYLQFGADELRQGLLFLLGWTIGIVAYVCGFTAVVVVAVAARAVGQPAQTLVTALAVLAMLASLVFLGVRLSLASALTFATRRVDLYGSWRLTRGQFWPMLCCYAMSLVLALVVLLLWCVVMAAMASMVGGPGGVAAISKPDYSSVEAYYTPARIVVSIASALAVAPIWAVIVMPPAHLYAQITGAAARTG